MGGKGEERGPIEQALADLRTALARFGLLSDEAETAARRLMAVTDLRRESEERTEVLRYYYNRAFDDGPAGTAALEVWRRLLEVVSPGWDDDVDPDDDSTVVYDMSTGRIMGPGGSPLMPDQADDALLGQVQELINAHAAQGDPSLLVRAVAKLLESDGTDPAHLRAAEEFGAELGRIARTDHDLRTAALSVALHEWACGLHLAQLGSRLDTLYDLTLDQDTILRAIQVRRAALDLVGEDSPAHPNIEGDLCAGLWTYGRNMDVTALDEALERLPRVIAHPALDPSIRPGWIWNLGAVLRDRGVLASDGGSISEAMGVHEQALREAEERGWPDEKTFEIRWSLATTIHSWWAYSHNPKAGKDSVDMFRDLLAKIPPNNPRLAPALNDFGIALHSMPYGDGSDARESAAVLRRALALIGPGDAIRPRVLANLVASLWAPADHGTVLPAAEIDELIALATESVGTTPEDSPELGHRLNHLGRVHALRFERHHDTTDLDAALEALRGSAEYESSPLWVRWNSAYSWVETAAAAGAWESAAQGCVRLVGLIPLASGELVRRRDRELQLIRLGDALRNGAAAALHAGQAELALDLLESGRGVLLRHAMVRAAAVEELREKAPDLVDTYVALRKTLDQDDGSQQMARAVGDTAHRIAAAEELRALIEHIRTLPGLEDFPATGASHATDTSTRTVVVLNLSSYRSDAIIVGARDGGEPLVVPLPLVTPDTVAAQVRALYGALDRRGPTGADAGGEEQTERAVVSVLAWTWDAVVAPVLAALGWDHRSPAVSRPRLWWSPTGALTLLPLHAALRPADGATTKLCALECVVSSYTPTLAALRKPAMPAAPAQSASVVAMPVTRGHADLPGVRAEAEAVAGCYPGSVPLVGADATHTAVASALSRAAVAHFACHALNVPEDPSRSGLVLADGTLSVAELSVQDLEGHAFLAYLSACDTARGGRVLTDEAITLCAGLVLAGFTHAVGTLWPVDDAAAAFLAGRFHQALARRLGRGEAVEPARILNQLAEWTSGGWPDRPSRWATLIHFGG
ncbi:CHAT domain-containing protein [Streptomyces sp. Ag109_G2-15]|uniref:CHAT domain-containing protein n=1 Tax=Streptomyces sp. Ag109_G2-15 TaxID=1938850 RepID=UPI000BD6DC70|nr:CHAT domain-containing protein [Streptomyces sp. Ag109_G2-15]SOD87447.1 CHAT domain-containing protein [Streptomyces sp. Ag109_G2-15]